MESVSHWGLMPAYTPNKAHESVDPEFDEDAEQVIDMLYLRGRILFDE